MKKAPARPAPIEHPATIGPRPSREYLLPPGDKLEPLFCKKCGKRLVDHFHERGYHPSTGSRIFEVYSDCVHRRHWFDGHNGYWRSASFWGDEVRTTYYYDGTEAI